MKQRSFQGKAGRRASIAAGAVAFALALSACSGTGGGGSGSETLTIMFWGDERAPEQWKEIGEDFTADGHEDVEFEFIHQPAEYDTKLQTLVAANNAPDVFLMASAGMGRFIDSGALLDLAPVYGDLGVDLQSDYLEQAVWTEGENVWGISPLISLMVMFYDKAAFDEAGVEYPPTDAANAWTWDEFADAAEKLSDPSTTDDGWGAMVLTDPLVTAPLLASNGGYWFSEDATEFTLNEPESVEVFDSIKALSDGGASIPPENLSSMGLDVVLQSRQAAMYPGGTWNLPAIQEAWGDDAGMAVLPSFGDAKSMAVTDQLVASKATENPELAAEFIHFATQPENNPSAYDSLPAVRSASEGDGRTAWLEASDRPDGFEETITSALATSMNDPSRKVRDLIEVWNTVAFTDAGVAGYFTGLVSDLESALTGLKPTVDEQLQGG